MVVCERVSVSEASEWRQRQTGEGESGEGERVWGLSRWETCHDGGKGRFTDGGGKDRGKRWRAKKR